MDLTTDEFYRSRLIVIYGRTRPEMGRWKKTAFG